MASTKKSTGGSKTPSGKSDRRKSTKRKAGSADAAEQAPVDPREPVPLTPKAFEHAVAAIEAIVATLEPAGEPGPVDLVDVLMHAVFGAGVPCGVAQEAVRRIADEFVDRNEFRITEAFEVELLLDGLGIPDLFVRCQTVQQAVNQIYADQNKVALDHLREAAISERKSFFQRVPAVSNDVARYIGDVLSWEEIAFSTRSTQRVQQRVGLDPKEGGEDALVDRLRAALAPFGHLPLRVAPDRKDGKPITEPELCPTCVLARLAAEKS